MRATAATNSSRVAAEPACERPGGLHSPGGLVVAPTAAAIGEGAMPKARKNREQILCFDLDDTDSRGGVAQTTQVQKREKDIARRVSAAR